MSENLVYSLKPWFEATERKNAMSLSSAVSGRCDNQLKLCGHSSTAKCYNNKRAVLIPCAPIVCGKYAIHWKKSFRRQASCKHVFHKKVIWYGTMLSAHQKKQATISPNIWTTRKYLEPRIWACWSHDGVPHLIKGDFCGENGFEGRKPKMSRKQVRFCKMWRSFCYHKIPW